MPDQHDFGPAADWSRLRLRADLLARTRQFFSARGFLEVETPLLSADVVVDRFLEPLCTRLTDEPRRPDAGRTLWLQTSPEFCMKRLMAAGGDAIYQITRAFRAGETGPLHNPEFTMVEWYARGHALDDAMRLTSDLTTTLLGTGDARRISYAEAFAEHVGVDPHRASPEELLAAARRHGLSLSVGLARGDCDELLNLLLAQCIEPHLGRECPVLLYDYPASQAALARVEGDPPVARRFELYLQGIELANGYDELTDAVELRRRQQVANAHRAADGRCRLPDDSRLLAAMEHGLPNCTGVALGFDRLLMLAAGAESLEAVLAFPIDRA